MEIIVRGSLPEEKEFQGTCHNCKTVFKCKRHEGTYHSDQRDGESLAVVCPVCGKPTYAYPNSKPSWNQSSWYDR